MTDVRAPPRRSLATYTLPFLSLSNFVTLSRPLLGSGWSSGVTNVKRLEIWIHMKFYTIYITNLLERLKYVRDWNESDRLAMCYRNSNMPERLKYTSKILKQKIPIRNKCINFVLVYPYSRLTVGCSGLKKKIFSFNLKVITRGYL